MSMRMAVHEPEALIVCLINDSGASLVSQVPITATTGFRSTDIQGWVFEKICSNHLQPAFLDL